MHKDFTKDVRNNAYEITEEGALYLPRQRVLVGGRFGSEVRNSLGDVIAPYEEGPNLVVNEGLNHILDVVFAGGTVTNPWYVGVHKANTPVVAGTLGSGVSSLTTEIEAADVVETARETYVETVTTNSCSNSASKASYTVDTGKAFTAYGAWLIDVSTIGGAGDAAAVLLAGSLFATSRVLTATDELLVTYTITANDA